MPASLASVEAEALLLSPEDRATLADHLLASLASEREVEEAWAEEITRRINAIESGEMTVSPVEQAISRARQSLQ
jgi:putative addiction module component (TIGR02574 family)